MSRYANKCYKTGENIQKLVIFIHGYNGNTDDIEYGVNMLLPKLYNAVVVTPESPIVCEKNPDKKQWYSLKKFDVDNLRRNAETPLEKIIEIYNQAGEQLSVCAKNMNLFVDEMQAQYKVDDKHTYIIGFSQGAMMALYTSLTRKNKIGGCAVISGIVAGKDKLEEELASYPEILLLHGEDDVTVQYKSFEFSRQWLLNHGLHLKSVTFPNLAHKMNEMEMTLVAKMINE